MKWFEIEAIDKIDSPSMVLYKERLEFNLSKMLQLVDNEPLKLMPHVKTNKMPKVIKMMCNLGIYRFKSATIAEAELAAAAGAKEVLIAHQLVGPKIKRIFSLARQFESCKFSTLIDNSGSCILLSEEAQKQAQKLGVYIDINNGMDRTGIILGPELNELIDQVIKSKYLIFKGLHVYDGHLRQVDFMMRKLKIETGFLEIEQLFEHHKKKLPTLQLIAGGSPSFSTHLSAKNRICSPGTCVFWDWGYSTKLKEQTFKFAALIITRVISKPKPGIVTIDMGHKAVASENPIDKRIVFLNLEGYNLLSQSEEHGVLQVDNWDQIKVGDVFYGVPYHVCPSINLYDEVTLISQHQIIDSWQITGRKRKITF